MVNFAPQPFIKAIFLAALTVGGLERCSITAVEDSARQVRLKQYILERGLPPEQYVADKFKDHDIVFLGEYHRIKHDPELIQRLIPVLHQAGVRNVGMEFAIRRDQDDIDRLITAASFDEALARKIIWNGWPFWGFREYLDIFRAAWDLNSRLAPGDPRFRIVGLNAPSDWSNVWTAVDRNDSDVMKKVYPEGSPDDVMAEKIIREFIDKDLKALVYSGCNHAYTEYRQPVCVEKGRFVRFITTRMGNQLAARGVRGFHTG